MDVTKELADLIQIELGGTITTEYLVESEGCFVNYRHGGTSLFLLSVSILETTTSDQLGLLVKNLLDMWEDSVCRPWEGMFGTA